MLHIRQRLDPLALLGIALYFVMASVLWLLNAGVSKFVGSTSFAASFVVSWIVLFLLTLIFLATTIIMSWITWLLVLIIGVGVLPVVVPLELPINALSLFTCVSIHLLLVSVARAVEILFSTIGYIDRSSDIGFAILGVVFILVDLRTVSALPTAPSSSSSSSYASTFLKFILFASITASIYAITGIQKIGRLIGEVVREGNRIDDLQNSYWCRSLLLRMIEREMY